jgi:hypothetical protein
MGGPVAILTAVIVFVIFAQAWHRWRRDHPSPTGGVTLWEWVKQQVIGDPDRDPDPDPDPGGGGGRYPRYIDVDENYTRIVRDSKPAPIHPPDNPGRSEISRWVADSISNGARYTDIVNTGCRLFGVSEATMKREYRKAGGSDRNRRGRP